MDYLPKDPAILVSSVNMLLRETKDSIETAYSFLHQKQRIYVHSTLDWQKDDIELAISDYANDMSQELFDAISGGRADFLRDHKRFQEDITKAVEILEKML